ncbi:serine hydrolase [Streptomyces sp. NBC_01264]|uniref:serine hydrolase n=1 Tax=Streptomyces sp. NBC_01264 TaxID=2903804 RepID=UPI002253C42F|nr:serine hydrolase [Streptomyces sp. NBC_01264]MCX4776003.1 class A beta-lactamase-related serine hydrolase [Streptomyces sp. NBC_01264]
MALHRSPSRIRRRLAAFATMAALAGGITFAHARSEPRDGTFATAAAASTTATPVPTTSPTTTSAQVKVEEAAREVLAGAEGNAAVAVLDLSTGESARVGADRDFVTASIVKVDILATLLLQASDAGRLLTAQEQRWATVMIENSDNAAANALWDAIGGAEGMAEANLRLGLTETTPGHGAYWGLTQTTSADQLRLLQAVFGEESVLSADARAYLRGLMGSIAPDQDWGISAGLEDSGSVYLKNGWLARSESGLWVVNSIGRVEAGGHTLLLAVLCDGQTSQKAGISLVEDLAELTRLAVTDG